MKIVILDGFITNPGDLSWDGFCRLGEVVVHDRTAPDKIGAVIGPEAGAVLSNGTHLDSTVLDACPGLEYIGLLSTGYNYVDVDDARRRGITVTNVPDYSSMAVAQHALALLLEITNGVGYYNDSVQTGRWTDSPDTAYYDLSRPLVELDGLTMGIVGYGAIGSSLARMALALGMKVVATRRRPEIPPRDAGVSYMTLEELFWAADVVSLHVPITPDTREMIQASSLARMRDGVILINASRGQLVREADLAAALRSGKVAAYGADVAAIEPLRSDNPLLGIPTCFLTPHLAWAPLATRRRLLEVALANLAAFLNGTPVNVVNPGPAQPAAGKGQIP